MDVQSVDFVGFVVNKEIIQQLNIKMTRTLGNVAFPRVLFIFHSLENWCGQVQIFVRMTQV